MKTRNDMAADPFEETKLFLARYLTYKFAAECLNLMGRNKDNIADVGVAYLFLGSNALEMYGKSFMCLRWEKEEGLNLEEINRRATSFGHDLERIYHTHGVGAVFLKEAGIEKVELKKQKKSPQGLDFHYFEFNQSQNLIPVYPIESLRYGVLTPKKNDFLSVQQHALFNLCNSVQNTLLSLSKKYLKDLSD